MASGTRRLYICRGVQRGDWPHAAFSPISECSQTTPRKEFDPNILTMLRASKDLALYQSILNKT